jgi:hypothetical protein
MGSWFNRYMAATRAMVEAEKGGLEYRTALARVRALQREFCRRTGKSMSVFPMNKIHGVQGEIDGIN